MIEDPDLTADPHSGGIGARWEGVYPHYDKAQDPRARRAMTENGPYVIYALCRLRSGPLPSIRCTHCNIDVPARPRWVILPDACPQS